MQLSPRRITLLGAALFIAIIVTLAAVYNPVPSTSLLGYPRGDTLSGYPSYQFQVSTFDQLQSGLAWGDSTFVLLPPPPIDGQPSVWTSMEDLQMSEGSPVIFGHAQSVAQELSRTFVLWPFNQSVEEYGYVTYIENFLGKVFYVGYAISRRGDPRWGTPCDAANSGRHTIRFGDMVVHQGIGRVNNAVLVGDTIAYSYGNLCEQHIIFGGKELDWGLNASHEIGGLYDVGGKLAAYGNKGPVTITTYDRYDEYRKELYQEASVRPAKGNKDVIVVDGTELDLAYRKIEPPIHVDGGIAFIAKLENGNSTVVQVTADGVTLSSEYASIDELRNVDGEVYFHVVDEPAGRDIKDNERRRGARVAHSKVVLGKEVKEVTSPAGTLVLFDGQVIGGRTSELDYDVFVEVPIPGLPMLYQNDVSSWGDQLIFRGRSSVEYPERYVDERQSVFIGDRKYEDVIDYFPLGNDRSALLVRRGGKLYLVSGSRGVTVPTLIRKIYQVAEASDGSLVVQASMQGFALDKFIFVEQQGGQIDQPAVRATREYLLDRYSR